MTEEDYLKHKHIFDREHDEIEAYLDVKGYGVYKDGAGDFGTRRLRDESGNIVSEIIIHDMIPDYYGNYPDFQFYNRTTDKVLGYQHK
jgi:hypothetical protein